MELQQLSNDKLKLGAIKQSFINKGYNANVSYSASGTNLAISEGQIFTYIFKNPESKDILKSYIYFNMKRNNKDETGVIDISDKDNTPLSDIFKHTFMDNNAKNVFQ